MWMIFKKDVLLLYFPDLSTKAVKSYITIVYIAATFSPKKPLFRSLQISEDLNSQYSNN